MLGKSLQAAVAGQATGGATYVEDVFSTYLYTGNGSSQVIENGIRLGDANAGGSVYFDGSGDGLQIANSSNFNISSGDFTLEAWIYPTTYTASYQAIVDIEDASISNYSNVQFRIWLSSTGSILVDAGSSSTGTGSPAVSISGGSAPQNTWTHIAATRNGNTFTLWVNGTSVGTQSFSGSFYWDTNKLLYIGYGQNASYLFNGNISNLRLVKGSAVYTAGFTPPTSALTAVTNTQLLACQGDTPFTDNSTNGFTITQYGNVAAKSFGPFTSDVAGEGGLVWIKERNNISTPALFDTVRGTGYVLSTTNTSANISTDALTAFNSDGFSLKYPNTNDFYVNRSSQTYASWTFRKAPKFFDVVTWTGNGANPRAISHSLGSAPGCIIIKRTSDIEDWKVYHRSLATSYYLQLNTTDAQINNTTGKPWNTTPTDTEFYVGGSGGQNITDETYVAYLFAHDAGGFGDAGDQSVIKCGSYTGDGTAGGPLINLGWEPQWILSKKISDTGSWILSDSMRPLGAWNGVSSGGVSSPLFANSTSAEDTGGDYPAITSTGYYPTNQSGNILNVSGATYIYIAIRRGPMKTPTDGTSVFAPVVGTDSSDWTFNAGFPVDLHFYSNRASSSDKFWFDRLRGSEYLTSTTQNAGTSYTVNFDYMNYVDVSGSTNNGWMLWNLRRAPGFFDVIGFQGQTGGRTVNHNLGVSPELVISKVRNLSGTSWWVFHKDLGLNSYLEMNSTGSVQTLSNTWNPSATDIYFNQAFITSSSSYNVIAYLFASCPGVSKVGSFVGDGTDGRVIDCGFSNGARFVMMKKASTTGNWIVYDTARGIVSGNDPYLFINSTAAEVTTSDFIDPASSGFAVNSSLNTTDTWIYLAIA